MAAGKAPRSAVAVFTDMRRDWRGWSRVERFSAKLAGAGVVSLAILLHLPL